MQYLAPFKWMESIKNKPVSACLKRHSFRVLHFCMWCKFLWCDPVSRFLAKGPLVLSRRSTPQDSALMEALRMLSILLSSWMVSELPALCLDLQRAARPFAMVPFCEEMNGFCQHSVWRLCHCPYCCPYRIIG